MTNANAMQSECPRCKRDESYGCTCTSQEMVKWQADRIDALEAALRASEVDAEKWRKFATTAASYFKQDIDATLPEVE